MSFWHHCTGHTCQKVIEKNVHRLAFVVLVFVFKLFDSLCRFSLMLSATLQLLSVERPLTDSPDSVYPSPNGTKTKLTNSWWTQWSIQQPMSQIFPLGVSGDRKKARNTTPNKCFSVFAGSVSRNCMLATCLAHKTHKWHKFVRLLLLALDRLELASTSLSRYLRENTLTNARSVCNTGTNFISWETSCIFILFSL